MSSCGKAVATTCLVLVAAMVALAFVGCAEVAPSPSLTGTHPGPSRDLGNGRAHAFITLDARGEPAAVGVRLSEGALTGLPAEPPPEADGWEYLLPLPKEASASGYDHIALDWNPKGHVPPGIYDVPHFDFHFYLVSQGERQKITAVGDDLARTHRAPLPDRMPEGYVLPEGTAVPRMGGHAIDPAAPEFNKQPFTRTFLYGFYDGEVIFVEPMVTQAFLETKPNVVEPVRVPTTVARPGYYPARYSVKYDAAKREYVVALENLVRRP